MKKIKLVIIILVIILVILLIMLVIKGQIKKNKQVSEGQDIDKYTARQLVNIPKKLESNAECFEVKNYIDRYYNLCNTMYEHEYMFEGKYTDEMVKNLIDDSYNSAYNMLDKEYIEKYAVTNKSMQEEFSKNNGKEEFLIEDIYIKDYTENLSLYFVYGKIINEKTQEVKDYAFIVKKDIINSAFSLYPYKYVVDNNLTIEQVNNNMVNIKEISEIENNGDNSIEDLSINEDIFARNLYEHYINEIKYNTEKAYKITNIESEGVNDYDSFINYLKQQIFIENYEKIISCGKSESNNYIIRNDNDDVFIFKANTLIDYTVRIEETNKDME